MARQLFFVKEIDCFYPMTWYCIQKIWTEKDEQKLHEKYLVLKEQAEKQAAFYEERRKEMFGQPEIVGYGNGEPQNEQ
jgi:hypothetical protein